MIAYFKMKFIVGLQYRASAFAAILTQIFFGIVYISVYLACYESGTTSNLPMPLNELVSYLWLNQIFFALIYLWYKDNEILTLIKQEISHMNYVDHKTYIICGFLKY
jgi:ABC-2 type transport system permease protein